MIHAETDLGLWLKLMCNSENRWNWKSTVADGYAVRVYNFYPIAETMGWIEERYYYNDKTERCCWRR